ncbi:hypothetical protein HMI62_21895 [Serratia marcescens]|nr:hypothetical protein HMI62_21895 [Serratia marcescens]
MRMRLAVWPLHSSLSARLCFGYGASRYPTT